MIELVNDSLKANCITHCGTMHADEVFATAFLSLYKENIKVFRASKVLKENIKDDVLIYDIGRGKYDHHQEGRELRPNNIPYCSLGLLWKEFGKDFLKKRNIDYVDEVFEGIDKDFIEGIDAIDNGIFPKVEADYRIKNICDIIKLFNPSFGSKENESEQFIKAVDVATKIFEEEILNINGKIKAYKKIESKLDSAKEKHYLMLDEFMPFEEAIYNLDTNKEIYFVAFPSNRGGYSAKTIYNSFDDKTQRVPFPASWAGLDEKLSEVTNVEGALFCHLGRFIISAKTKDAIIKLIEIAIKEKEEVPDVQQ